LYPTTSTLLAIKEREKQMDGTVGAEIERLCKFFKL
jgi:hypothetical protein